MHRRRVIAGLRKERHWASAVQQYLIASHSVNASVLSLLNFSVAAHSSRHFYFPLQLSILCLRLQNGPCRQYGRPYRHRQCRHLPKGPDQHRNNSRDRIQSVAGSDADSCFHSKDTPLM